MSPEQGAPGVQTLACPDEAVLVWAADAVVVAAGDDTEELEEVIALGLLATGSGLDTAAGVVYA